MLRRYVVFSEYRVGEQNREPYLAAVEAVRGDLALLEPEVVFHVCEGMDQPGLYVETYETDELAKAKAWVERRGLPDPEFAHLLRWVEGGSANVKFWTFERRV